MPNPNNYSSIADNYTNGNISDFKEAILNMNRKHLLKFVQYCETNNLIAHKEKVFNIISEAD